MKTLVIKDASFETNSLDNISMIFTENDFSWDKGGITSAGQSSGSTNTYMSNIGLPLQFSGDRGVVLKTVGNYKIRSVLTSTHSGGSEYKFDSPLDIERLTINPYTYYQVSIGTIDKTNANTALGKSVLLICKL